MPRLRTALYAFAWVGVTANVILLCMYLSAGSLVTRYGPGTMGVVGMLLLAIALHIAQILYVRAIERSESTLARRCSEIETFKRGVLIVVSTLFIVVGLFGVFNAGMTNDAVYEEEDTVRQAEVQKQIARILKAIKKGKIQASTEPTATTAKVATTKAAAATTKAKAAAKATKARSTHRRGST